MCLRGASEVHDAIFAARGDSDLRGYVVWVPKAGGAEEHVARAARSLPDPRLTHYWDGHGAVMAAHTAAMALGEDAWDMYLVHDAGAVWTGDHPPRPALWMHQLGERDAPRVSGPYLDPDELARQVARLLDPADSTD